MHKNEYEIDVFEGHNTCPTQTFFCYSVNYTPFGANFSFDLNCRLLDTPFGRRNTRIGATDLEMCVSGVLVHNEACDVVAP